MTDFPKFPESPMLASDMKGDLNKLTYPLYVSPKVDGIRCLTGGGVVLSRRKKLIPNCHVQRELRGAPAGWDGELVVGPPNKDPYRRTLSGVMSADGEPNFTLWVFDHFLVGGEFSHRLRAVKTLVNSAPTNLRKRVKMLPQMLANTPYQVTTFEEKFLEEGYEGAMLRSVDGPYKHGRSTVREGYLLKLKRFVDGEAVITGFSPLMNNLNEAKINALGLTERSSHKAGKRATELLGSLEVLGISGGLKGVKFDLGTGFTAEERVIIWRNREILRLNATVVRVRYFPTGSKERPRYPTFCGFRSGEDM